MSVGEIVKYATQYAIAGFHVFPLFKATTDRGYSEPIGWNGNKPEDPRSQPATGDLDKIAQWSKLNLHGYGICGWGKYVLVDLDNKHGKNGVANFKALREKYDIPKPFLVVKTKSGGAHCFYKRSDTMTAKLSKQVNYTFEGLTYAGIDIFCDEGYVVGPTKNDDWVEGSYSILSGSITDQLPVFPDALLEHLKVKTGPSKLASELAGIYTEPSIKDQIRMGKLPAKIPCGERDATIMTFIGFHKAKGLAADAINVLANEFINRCDLDKGETRDSLRKELDVEGKIARIYNKPTNEDNPIDLAKALAPKLYKLTEEVPGKNMFMFASDTGLGMDIMVPKPADQFIQDFKRYERPVQISNDESVKPKIVNPFSLIVNSWDNTVNTASFFGYKPTNEFMFEHVITGKKIINSYKAPFVNFIPSRIETDYIQKFENFVHWLWGDDHEFAMNWIAHLIKSPELKMSVAPVLISQSHGVGKNIFVYNVANMLGLTNFSNASMPVILDKHFSLTDKVLIQINEVAAHHATQRHILVQFMSKLKDLISEYSLTINPKFKSERDTPFYGNFILCTNSLTSILLEIEDRRLIINHILHERLNPEFTDVARYVKDQSISNDTRQNIFFALREHFKSYTSTMDLTNYRAPMTSQKEELMINSMAPSHALLYEYFRDTDNLGVHHDVISAELIMLIARKLGISEVERKSYLIKALMEQHIIELIRVLPSNKHSKDSRKFNSCPEFDPDHELIVFPSERHIAKKQLYTLRNHKTYNSHSNDAIMSLYIENINSMVIQKSKADILNILKKA